MPEDNGYLRKFFLKIRTYFQPSKTKLFISLGLSVFLLVATFTATYLIKNVQNYRGMADEGSGDSLPENYINNIPLDSTAPIYGFRISGDVRLDTDISFARAVLIDANNLEYLVYESYSSIAESNQFSVNNECEETCVLDGVIPVTLRLEGFESEISSVKTKTFSNRNELNLNGKSPDEAKRLFKLDKAKDKVDSINKLARQKGKEWQAGETSVSNLTYSEKKKLFGSNAGRPLEILPNLQGLEFYKGGVFVVPSLSTLSLLPFENVLSASSEGDTNIPNTATPPVIPTPTPTPTPVPVTPRPSASLQPSGKPTPIVTPTPQWTQFMDYPLSWDWRNRHGVNWITPIRDQLSCGSCWAFGTIASVEALINVYYNQLLNINLSEQDSVCRHPGSCLLGGYPSDTLDELQNQGLVLESCYPYTGTESCPGRCSGWDWFQVKISNYTILSNMGNENIKIQLITKGPLLFGISSWWHVMSLVGYDIDSQGRTVWTFKNSWGRGWGEDGFVRAVVPLNDRYWVGYAERPYYPRDPAKFTIACQDNDRDGYCNWGISTTKPSTCSQYCRPQKDCDDSNARLGPFDAKFNCSKI